MREQTRKWLDTLPYPAVVTPKETGRMYRNRFARCLLPVSNRLKEELFDFGGDFIKELRLDGITYLVLALPEPDGSRVFCFFQHFLPLQEVFSRAIMEKIQDFFWTLLNKEDTLIPENAAQSDQIAARACFLRRHGDNYLRLLNTPKILEKEEAKSCSLAGFFTHLHTALAACDVGISFQFRDGATVCSESSVLSFLTLNLIHFAHLFEGERNISLNVEEEAEGVRFSVEFSDGGAVADAMENLIRYGRESDKLLNTLPMLCVLRVCMEKGIPWCIKQKSGKLSFSFLLAKGDERPALFFSDATAAEVAEFLQMVKEIFS